MGDLPGSRRRDIGTAALFPHTVKKIHNLRGESKSG
jgi:hypothetical protein